MARTRSAGGRGPPPPPPRRAPKASQSEGTTAEAPGIHDVSGPAHVELLVNLPGPAFDALWQCCSAYSRASLFATCRAVRDKSLETTEALSCNLYNLYDASNSDASMEQGWRVLAAAVGRSAPPLKLRLWHHCCTIRTLHDSDLERVLQRAMALQAPWSTAVTQLRLEGHWHYKLLISARSAPLLARAFPMLRRLELVDVRVSDPGLFSPPPPTPLPQTHSAAAAAADGPNSSRSTSTCTPHDAAGSAHAPPVFQYLEHVEMDRVTYDCQAALLELATWDALSRLPRLQSVSLRTWEGHVPASLVSLANIPGLTRLVIQVQAYRRHDTLQLDTMAWNTIRSCSHLTTLSLPNCDVSREGLQVLLAMPSLTHLTVQGLTDLTTALASAPCTLRTLRVEALLHLHMVAHLPLHSGLSLQLCGLELDQEGGGVCTAADARAAAAHLLRFGHLTVTTPGLFRFRGAYKTPDLVHQQAAPVLVELAPVLQRLGVTQLDVLALELGAAEMAALGQALGRSLRSLKVLDCYLPATGFWGTVLQQLPLLADLQVGIEIDTVPEAVDDIGTYEKAVHFCVGVTRNLRLTLQWQLLPDGTDTPETLLPALQAAGAAVGAATKVMMQDWDVGEVEESIEVVLMPAPSQASAAGAAGTARHDGDEPAAGLGI